MNVSYCLEISIPADYRNQKWNQVALSTKIKNKVAWAALKGPG